MPFGPDVDDDDMIAAARGGDRAAFEALLRRHYDRIHGLAWQLLGSRADADDVAQDVCCALVERLANKVEVDFDTARRLFTLIYALHWKG